MHTFKSRSVRSLAALAAASAMTLCAATAEAVTVGGGTLSPSNPIDDFQIYFGSGSFVDGLTFKAGATGTLDLSIFDLGISGLGLKLEEVGSPVNLLSSTDTASLTFGDKYELFISGKYKYVGIYNVLATEIAAVPEPAEWVLMLTGAAIMGGLYLRRRAGLQRLEMA